MTTQLDLTVYFDFVCPWCLIGKRHLQTALEQLKKSRPEVGVRIDWRSHQLLPDIPIQGVDYEVFYVNRLGSPAAVAARREQVRQAARGAGLEPAFEKIGLMPNTLRAHQMVELVAPLGSPEQLAKLIDRVFTAYFMEGRDIGDTAVLTTLAGELGYAAEPLAAGLADPEQQRQLARRLAAPPRHQVSGVPFFVFNRLAISGARLPSDLLAAMMQTLETAPIH
jgi:predicted DsbA family dithiol-disulfide isomerase